MGLLEAFLLDDAPIDFWIAVRTDRNGVLTDAVWSAIFVENRLKDS